VSEGNAVRTMCVLTWFASWKGMAVAAKALAPKLASPDVVKGVEYSACLYPLKHS
jgi:hypothetical protein